MNEPREVSGKNTTCSHISNTSIKMLACVAPVCSLFRLFHLDRAGHARMNGAVVRVKAFDERHCQGFTACGEVAGARYCSVVEGHVVRDIVAVGERDRCPRGHQNGRWREALVLKQYRRRLYGSCGGWGCAST